MQNLQRSRLDSQYFILVETACVITEKFLHTFVFPSTLLCKCGKEIKLTKEIPQT